MKPLLSLKEDATGTWGYQDTGLNMNVDVYGEVVTIPTDTWTLLWAKN